MSILVLRIEKIVPKTILDNMIYNMKSVNQHRKTLRLLISSLTFILLFTSQLFAQEADIDNGKKLLIPIVPLVINWKVNYRATS